jgi:hypothetical protein
VHRMEQVSANVEADQGGGNAEGSVSLTSEGSIADLGCLEGADDVSGRSEHCEVASNSGREGDL